MMARTMDHMRNRLTFDLGSKQEIHYHSVKELTRIGIIAKFNCKTLSSTENIPMQNRQILYTFVLWAKVCDKISNQISN